MGYQSLVIIEIAFNDDDDNFTTYSVFGSILNGATRRIHILLSLLFLLFNYRELSAGELAAALGLLLAPFELLLSSGSLLVLVALLEDESPVDTKRGGGKREIKRIS